MTNEPQYEIDELRTHKPEVGCSTQPTATIPQNKRRLGKPTNGRIPRAQNHYALGPNLAVLFCPSANGKVFGVTIDREDLPRVLALGEWLVANFDRANGRVNLYAYKKRSGRTIYMHRFILNAPQDRQIEVDHENLRSLDNRKSNIRLTTKSVNQQNKRPKALWPSRRLVAGSVV